MSGVENIAGSIAASQITSAQSTKRNAAIRNQQAANSRELARLADVHEHEVEDTDQIGTVRVFREDERQGHDGREDTFEHDEDPDSEASDEATSSEESTLSLPSSSDAEACRLPDRDGYDASGRHAQRDVGPSLVPEAEGLDSANPSPVEPTDDSAHIDFSV